MIAAIVDLSLSSPSAPSAPRNFSLEPVSGGPRQLLANWTIPDPTNGIIFNYTVTCNESLVFSFDEAGAALTGSGIGPMVGSGNLYFMVSVLLEELTPFTTYECTVYAATGGGVGDASQPSVAMTVEDGKL